MPFSKPVLLYNSILDLFFPRTCPCCGQVLADYTYLCNECVARLDRTEQALLRDNSTEILFHQLPHFAYGGSWLHYVKHTQLQRLIHLSKFGNGNPPLLRQLGSIAATEWKDTGFFDNIDVLVPVPLHSHRLRSRGFNQTEYIVQGMAEVLHLPIDTTHLTRQYDNPQQSLSSAKERKRIATNLFAVNHPEEWYGKTILLVDDIITTGTTVSAAITAMKKVHRCKIVVFALAKTK